MLRQQNKKPSDDLLPHDDDFDGLPVEAQAGEIDPDMQKDLRSGIIYTLLAILGVAAFGIISFTGAPFVLAVFIKAFFAGSFVHLAGICYGIMNDIIGCNKFLPYFSLGHQDWQKGLIESNDSTAVAIAWGIFATKTLTVFAGSLFAVATLITGFCSLPFAGFLMPLIALAVPCVLYAANRYANKQMKEREESGKAREDEDVRNFKENGFWFLDSYQNIRLKHWVKDAKDINNWRGNGDRNGYGYVAMPILGVVGLITTITVTATAHFLPAVIFGAALSVFPPLGAGILMATALLAACAYLYAKHKTQVPGKPYKLKYPQPEAKVVDEFQSTHRRLSQRTNTLPNPAAIARFTPDCDDRQTATASHGDQAGHQASGLGAAEDCPLGSPARHASSGERFRLN